MAHLSYQAFLYHLPIKPKFVVAKGKTIVVTTINLLKPLAYLKLELSLQHSVIQHFLFAHHRRSSSRRHM